MKRIAIVGANGQVGTEVSLFLRVTEGVEPIAIVRSELGAALLKKLGIPCRIGALADAARAPALLAGCDLVADFSLPGGLPSQVRSATRLNIVNALRLAPSGAAYAFASSTMAIGMVPESDQYEEKIIARTLYARQKRYGERVARVAGSALGRRVFVMRLGQVHGELQSVSRHLRSVIDGRTLSLRAGGESGTDTVFADTIAQALVAMANGGATPGLYTLVEDPEWSMRQVVDFYASLNGVEAKILAEASSAPAGVFRSLVGQVFSGIAAQKELLTAQIIPPFPGVESRIKAWHQKRRVASELAQWSQAKAFPLPYVQGPVPGARVAIPSAQHPLTGDRALAVRSLLSDRLGPFGHNFRT